MVLVPSARVFDADGEAALKELARRRYPVWRVKADPPPGVRDRLAHDALAAGFEELLWADPAVVLDPDDVERLRARNLPIVAAAYPVPGQRAPAGGRRTGARIP